MSPDSGRTWGLFGTCSTPPHVASKTVSLKSLLLIPFYLGLLPVAEQVPLLEAYCVMHLKGVIRLMARAITSPSDIKGKISCLLPMIPSLEKRRANLAGVWRNRQDGEATGMQERKEVQREFYLFRSLLALQWPMSPSSPWFCLESVDHFSFFAIKITEFGRGNW